MNTLTTQTTDALVEEINREHEEADRLQQSTIISINTLIARRVRVAALVETAKANTGQGFRTWWETNNLPDGWAARYLLIAKTAKRQKLADKNQLRLLGILPEPESDGEERNHKRRADNPLAWVKVCGKLKASLTDDRIKQMDDTERQTAAMHLKPVVELYHALTEGVGR
jgi:hypothetical protein